MNYHAIGITRTTSREELPATPALQDTPTVRKATPIKERPLALLAFGRHRTQNDLDALVDELGTCQLQSALKGAPPTLSQPLSQAAGALELQPLALMHDD